MSTYKDQWIIGKKEDLLLLILPIFLSPLIIFMYYLPTLGSFSSIYQQTTFLLWAWVVFETIFDQPHIFRTFQRTHKDPVEYERHKKIHILLIPALFLTGISFISLNLTEELQAFIALIGSYHIFRQNYGLLKVYQRRGETPQKSADLWVCRCFYALFFFYLTAYLGREDIHLPLFNHLQSYSSLIETAALGSFVFTLLIALKKNLKHLLSIKFLFVGIIFCNYLLCRVFVPSAPLLLLIIAETIYHDIQYFGWMSFYESKRFNTKFKFFNNWFLLSLLYGLIFLLLDYMFKIAPKAALYLNMFAFMIVLYHYIIDGIIWRFSCSPELKALIQK